MRVKQNRHSAQGARSEITYFATVPMVMPVPNGCQNDVAPFHRHTFPVHRREATVAFDDEPHRERDMSVSWGGLVGHHQLQTAVDGIRGVGRLVPGRIDEHQHASLCLFLGDEFACAQQVGFDVLIAPDIRFALRIWRWRVEFGHLGPEGERVGVVRAQFVDQPVRRIWRVVSVAVGRSIVGRVWSRHVLGLVVVEMGSGIDACSVKWLCSRTIRD